MPAPFLLDTNAYSAFFQRNPPPFLGSLEERVTCDGIRSFYISEITSLEIHSVLGKYRRGCPMQFQACLRPVVADGGEGACSETWISRGLRPLTRRQYRDFCKMVNEVEAGLGDLSATVLRLDQRAVEAGRLLLSKYAEKYRFGSHDALIAGTLVSAHEAGFELTLTTRDRGLKASCRDEGLPYWDPANDAS